ncbi:hypothetical protein ACHAXS_006671 [Conticribra weissflogii]
MDRFRLARIHLPPTKTRTKKQRIVGNICDCMPFVLHVCFYFTVHGVALSTSAMSITASLASIILLTSNHHAILLASALATPPVPRNDNDFRESSKLGLDLTFPQSRSHIRQRCHDISSATYIYHASRRSRHRDFRSWTKPNSSTISRRRITSKLWAATDSDCAKDSSLSSIYNDLEPEEIANLPLSDVLQILNERNVRYAPDATRVQLEQLLLQYVVVGDASTPNLSSSRESGPSKGSRQINNFDGAKSEREEKEVIDVPVSRSSDLDGTTDNDALDVDILHDDDPFSSEEPYSRVHDSNDDIHRFANDESFVNRVRQPRREDDEQFQRPMDAYYSSPVGRRRQRNRTRVTRRQYPNDDYDDDSYWDRRRYQQSRQSRYRDRSKGRSRNDYDVRYYYDNTGNYYFSNGDGNIIDLETFNLSDNPNDDDDRGKPIYENGIQILLMGFYEAGKTATQLAVDAVADSIQIPFSNDREGRGEGKWYYDENLGREIFDANILDESKEYGGRRRSYVAGDGTRFYREPSRPYRRRNGAEYSRTMPRRQRRNYDETDEIHYKQMVPPRPIKERYSRPRRPRSRVRMETNEDGSPKSIYGLYSETEDDADANATDEILSSDTQQEHQQNQNGKQQPNRHWKDRVRHKFDIALGLDTPTTSDSESYYDSWKSQMEQMDDWRKEKLRNKLYDMESSSDVSAAKMQDAQSTDQKSSPNNRRARRRARMSSKTTESQPPTPFKTQSKSRTDDIPFWREGGSLASLLFDTQYGPDIPSGNGNRSFRRNPRKNSLERLILSPRGRDHTVTSLVVYSTRMVLSSFGILCRWAGVRGTIPQPIVVISVFASVVSARRGQRIVALLISLLGLRMVGEFIHGSLYGNEFWDDEYDSVAHAWGKDREDHESKK